MSAVPAALARRILAALVAVGLSGVPALTLERVGPGHGSRPHRCQCPAGRHDCTCPVCRGAARSARRAALEHVPPCHRAQALEALARDEEHEAGERHAAPAGASILRGSCERPDDRVPAAAAQQPVVLPTAARLVPGARVTGLPAPAGGPRARALEPELPPPRRA